jgi:hypothetical protein
MRYNHESYLPLGAFQPELGRMRLHGGGGNPLDDFSDFIGTGGGDQGILNAIDEGVQGVSDVFAAADDAIFQPITAPISQLTSALDEAVIQPITAPISDVGVAIDDAVADVIPGGWGTLVQVAASIASLGNPWVMAATSAGVNFAKNKDLESAIKAGAISGATAGITQGIGDEFQLGDIGRAGVSGGIQGGVNYAQTGDINSALKAGAQGAGMSYAGSQLSPYVDPYLNEIKGDFGKYLQEQGVNLSNFANPSGALDTNLSEAPQMATYNKELEYQKFANEMMKQGYSPAKLTTDAGEVVQGSFNDDFKAVPNFGESSLGDFENQPDLQRVSDVATNKVPNAQIKENKIGIGSVPFDFDTPVYYDGYVPMTPAQVAAANPDLYVQNPRPFDGSSQTYLGLPKELGGLTVSQVNQYYNNLPGAISEQYANQDLTEGYDKVKFRDDPVSYLASRGIEGKDYVINKATGAIDYLSNTNPLDYPGDLYDAAKDYYDKSSPTKLALTAAGLYGLSNLGGGSQQEQAAAEEAKKQYTYGTAGPASPNYLLKNRINASNVYSPATGYRPLTRYADGGEVEHFADGGLKKLSNFATRIAQPFEKAVIRPIGEAAPFLKDLAPYAGMAAGAMMGNPAMAAGIGGLASGFGKPGGFDMKRALMGGIAAYGMSNLAGGIEAAGMPEATLPAYPEAPIQPSSLVGSDTMFAPQGPSQAALQAMAKTDLANAPRDMFSLRDTDAMQKGIGNLLQNSNTPAYKDAMAALTNKVGIYNTGVPLIMGTTGMMGVDESNALKKEYDVATAKNQQDADKFTARITAGKKRAEQALRDNPYMFAEGGTINPPDDQTGMPNQTPMQKFEDGGIYNYAEGGDVQRYFFGGAITSMFEKLIAEQEAAKAAEAAKNAPTPPPVIPPTASQPTLPIPVPTSSPNRSTTGQYLISNPYGLEPLSAANIYEYQKKRGYAEGGVPRFLSGGGDGMSDSIRANIEGSQEARLADGEFVIPADVVSHLGNGSSKAGAKQLYDMMDRVRKARTGNPKQGREIKPTKLMPV